MFEVEKVNVLAGRPEMASGCLQSITVVFEHVPWTIWHQRIVTNGSEEYRIVGHGEPVDDQDQGSSLLGDVVAEWELDGITHVICVFRAQMAEI